MPKVCVKTKCLANGLHNDVILYRMEGNFGSGKTWQIQAMNTLAKENLANL